MFASGFHRGVWLICAIRAANPTESFVSPGAMWRKLLPFAIWVWVTNLLYNLFEVVDRYMVLHVGGLDDAQALIGQYHNAR